MARNLPEIGPGGSRSVFRSPTAERRIVLTDDFGQRIQMSAAQLHDLVADVKRGVLDAVVAL